DHASAERRLHESIGWNRRFYMEMVRKGVVPKPSSEDESTERPRKKLKKPSSNGTEGPSEPHHAAKAMSEEQMRKIINDQVAASMTEFMANMNRGTGYAGTDGAEAGGAGTGDAKASGAEAGGVGPAVPEITSDCKEKDKVKFTTATLQGRALTWWNGRIASMGIDAANGTP
nr:hypothetical protein [Tanacetum cinerariifolium]